MSATNSTALAVNHSDLEFLICDVLAQGGCFRFKAYGRSMWPFIRSGDALVIRKAKDRKIRHGDILLYRKHEGRLVAHRVTGIEDHELRIRGDRLRASLERVGKEQVLGRIVAIERDGISRPFFVLQLLARIWVGVRGFLRICRHPIRRLSTSY